MSLSLNNKVKLPTEEFRYILQKDLILPKELGHKERRKTILKIRRNTTSMNLPEITIKERYRRVFTKFQY